MLSTPSMSHLTDHLHDGGVRSLVKHNDHGQMNLGMVVVGLRGLLAGRRGHHGMVGDVMSGVVKTMHVRVADEVVERDRRMWLFGSWKGVGV